MNDSFKFTDEEWRSHLAAVEQRLEDLRQQEVDSRSLCGQLDGGWVRWPAERRAQHRQLLRDLWEEQAPQVPREGKALFLGGPDGGAKTTLLADPHSEADADQYLVIDAFRIEETMAARGMIPHIDGLSPMEASVLVHEEAWQLAERLAQKAYPEKCNVLWVTSFSGNPDRTDASQSPTLQAGQPQETVRALIERYQHGGMDFSTLVAALVSRWRTRPEKDVGPADWGEVYRRAEEMPDDDDLFWVSVAEDLGTLTLEQADQVFTAVQHAADERRGDISPPEGENDSTTSMRNGKEVITSWRYFADSNQAMIRVPVTDGPGRRGQRYWGHSAGWIAASPGCADWADQAASSPPTDR